MIQSMLELQEKFNDFLSPNFIMIDNGEDSVKGWFADDLKEAQKFTVFARTPSGDLFGYWNYESVKNPPIVFLGGECIGSKVIADSLEQFISLVAFGSNDYFLDIDFIKQDEEWEGIDIITETHEKFRKWLKENYSIEPAKSPLAIIKTALGNHPDLFEYIENWQNKKFK